MLITFINYILNKINLPNYLLSLYISVPIYLCLLYLSPLLQYYSSIIIGIDLFTFNLQIQNKNELKKPKKLTNDFTNLANKYFDYLQKNDVKNKKMIKNYVKTKLDIKDTLQHTINNISN